MKRFLAGYLAGAVSLFLGLAYYHAYRNATAIDRVRFALQAQAQAIRHLTASGGPA